MDQIFRAIEKKQLVKLKQLLAKEPGACGLVMISK